MTQKLLLFPASANRKYILINKQCYRQLVINTVSNLFYSTGRVLLFCPLLVNWAAEMCCSNHKSSSTKTFTCGAVSGNAVPPISNIPPTAVMPEMALVTDMSGEWRAGVTPHTVWYPTMPARPKVVIIVVKAGFGETIPNPNNPPKPGTQTHVSNISQYCSFALNTVRSFAGNLTTTCQLK
jgi:hypothetical protein